MARVECVVCNLIDNEEDMLFNEDIEMFYCDKDCFSEWADDNFDIVKDKYFERYVD